MNVDEYQPKRGMCANCTKMKYDCSKLDFKNMRILQQDFYFEKTIFIVLCNEFDASRRRVE